MKQTRSHELSKSLHVTFNDYQTEFRAELKKIEEAEHD